METVQRANEHVQRIISRHWTDMTQKRSSTRLEALEESSTNNCLNYENFVHPNDKFYSTVFLKNESLNTTKMPNSNIIENLQK